MASSFMWTTIYVLLWNYVLYTSGGITSYGNEDKSIDLRRRQWYATHNDNRQVKDTKSITNGKRNESSPIVGVDHMGHPFLRLPPSQSPVTVKKPLTQSNNRDKSLPKINDSIKSNRIFKTPQESSYSSMPNVYPDTSYNDPNIDYVLNNYGNAHTLPDNSISITDNHLMSPSSNEPDILSLMRQDNVSPQLVLKSSNPSILSNEKLSNSLINNEPWEYNAPQPIKSLEQRLWNEQMQSSFFDLPSLTSQFAEFPVDKPIIRPIPTDKDFFTTPSRIIDADQNESLKFLPQLPQTVHPKFAYEKEPSLENKAPLFSSSLRFMEPLDTTSRKQIQSDWPDQMFKTSGLKSQSAQPERSSLYEQQDPLTDLLESSKLTKTDTITSISKSIPMEKVESTTQMDEQQQQMTNLPESSQFIETSSITSTFEPVPTEKVESTSLSDEQQQQQMTNLPESSQLIETSSITSTSESVPTEKIESTSLSDEQQQQQQQMTNLPESSQLIETSSITSTSEPMPTEKVESNSLSDDQQQITNLPESPEFTETPSTSFTNKPTTKKEEEKKSTFPSYEQQLTTVTDELESPKLTESPFINSITSTSKPVVTEKEESTSLPHEKYPPLLPMSTKPVKIPAITTKPTPIPLKNKPSIFLPYEQSLINWLPSVPAQDDTSISMSEVFPYENEQKQLTTNIQQYITPSGNLKYYNKVYQQVLQPAFFTSQPIRHFIPFTRSEQNQVRFVVSDFSKPQDTLTEYYLHMLSENMKPCID